MKIKRKTRNTMKNFSKFLAVYFTFQLFFWGMYYSLIDDVSGVIVPAPNAPETTFTPTLESTITSTPTPILEPFRLEIQRTTDFIRNYSPNSPFLSNNRISFVYNTLNDINKVKIFFAIAGNESHFGISNLAKNCFNAWGYLYPSSYGSAGCGSPRWSDWDKSIARFIELEKDNWLDKFDGSRSSLDLYDSNHGNYCGKRDDCENWKKNIWWFINNL